MAQGFFRLSALADVAGNGGAARDMAFRVPDWEDGERHLNLQPALAHHFDFVVEDCFAAGDSLDKVRWLMPMIGRPQYRNRLTDDFRGGVFGEPLRAGVPAQDGAV